jgi:hypothetical protein
LHQAEAGGVGLAPGEEIEPGAGTKAAGPDAEPAADHQQVGLALERGQRLEAAVLIEPEGTWLSVGPRRRFQASTAFRG